MNSPVGLILPNQDLVDRILEQSRDSPRKRSFAMLRSASCPEEIPSIMINCFQLGTYVTPHKHPSREMWVVYQGLFQAVLFDEVGEVTLNEEIGSGRGKIPLIEFTGGTYHTIIPLMPDSVLIEFYLDVFNQNIYKQFAPWAASEDTMNYEKNDGYLEDLLKRINLCSR